MHRNSKGKPVNNERLEFLGDAVLDAVVGDIVYQHFPGKREGFLTNTRSKLVQRDTLNKLAQEMGINQLVLDDGCAFEIGFMRANHKPVVLVPFTEHPERPKKMNLMIAQGVTAIIDGNTELEKLAEYDFNWTPYIPVTGYGIY